MILRDRLHAKYRDSRRCKVIWGGNDWTGYRYSYERSEIGRQVKEWPQVKPGAKRNMNHQISAI